MIDHDNAPILFVAYAFGEGQGRGGPQVTCTVWATKIVQKMLWKLLSANAEHLAKRTKEYRTYYPREHASFLIPIRRLTSDESELLAKGFGCDVCGNPVRRRCARCLSAVYCGQGRVSRRSAMSGGTNNVLPALFDTECRRYDWQRHRAVCSSDEMVEAEWETFSAVVLEPDYEEALWSTIARGKEDLYGADPLKIMSKFDGSSAANPLPEALGSDEFLVKIALHPASSGSESEPRTEDKRAMLTVHDRKCSFRAFIYQPLSSGPGLACEHGSGGGGGGGGDPECALEAFMRLCDAVRATAYRSGHRHWFGNECKPAHGGARADVYTYRWARREDDGRLAICLDKVPSAKETQW